MTAPFRPRRPNEQRSVHLTAPEHVPEVLKALNDWLYAIMHMPAETPQTLSAAAISDLRITLTRARRAIKQLGDC
jgi:hypothetical protein